MAARDERALRNVARLYPLALVLIWLPAVMIGVWGAGAFPGLEPGEADTQEEDAIWLRQAMELIVSKPSVVSFVWQEQELPPGAKGPMPGSLIGATGRPKPAISHAIELRKAIQSGAATATSASEATA